jgi:hypothetical protein
MSDVLRMEIWSRSPRLLLVTVVKAATYEVRWTDCQRTINALLNTGGNPAAVPVDDLTVAADFGVAAAAEKYAKRLLLEQMQGGQPAWEDLYDGPLTIASLTRASALFPAALEAARGEAPIPTPTGPVVKGETPMDFAARRAAYRKQQARARDRADALAALSASERTVVRATGGFRPRVVGATVTGTLPNGDTVTGTLRRVTSRPPTICEIEAPMTAAGQRVEWTLFLDGTMIGVSNA